MLLMGGVGTVVLQSFRTIGERTAWVKHTYTVLGTLDDLNSSLSHMQAARRGYWLTRDPKFLAQHNGYAAELDGKIEHLRELTLDNPSQAPRIDTLKQILVSLNESTARSFARFNASTEDKIDMVGLKERDAFHHLIDSLFTEMRGAESQLLETRELASTASLRRAKLTTLTGGALGLLMLLVVFALFHRENSRREAVETKLRYEKSRLDLVAKSNVLGIVAGAQGMPFNWANDTFLNIIGYTRADFENGITISMLNDEAGAEHSRKLWKAIADSNSAPSTEKYYRRKDGTMVPVLVGASLVEGTKDAIAFVLDLSDQRRVEQELKKSHDQLAQSVAQLEKRTAQINLLGDMSSFLQTAASWEESFRLIEHYAQLLFQGAPGFVGLTRASRNWIVVQSKWTNVKVASDGFAPEECWALRTGKVHRVEPGSAGLLCEHHRERPRGESLCVPMIAQGETLGLFHLEAVEGRLPEPEQKLAATFAEQVSLTVASMQLRETLRAQAIRDPLTGLFNRRYLDETMTRELSRAARKAGSIGVLMLDLDHFKTFNDRFGHEGGDALLRAFGDLLRTKTRREDIACRYGGEEFTIILPDATIDVVRARAEDIRIATKQLEVAVGGRMLDHVTASIGVAMSPRDGVSSEILLQAADAALYQAKARGRDQVVVTGDLIAKPDRA